VSPKKQAQPQERRAPQLPRNALTKIKLGVSFAEYDDMLRDPWVFVDTPASLAAADVSRQKYYFVGRRGTGKTATSLHLLKADHHSRALHPEIFSPSEPLFDPEEFRDPRQKPHRSLVAAFRRTLHEELLGCWCGCCGATSHSLAPPMRQAAERAIAVDFDTRLLSNLQELLVPLAAKQDVDWHALMNVPKRLGSAMAGCRWAETKPVHTIVIDRLDDYWDGSDLAVAFLSALMHAALLVNTEIPKVRVLIFLRENVFERVRAIDPEFARLETSVVGLGWTREQLTELVERRFNKPFNTRIALGGETWSYFFASPAEAYQLVFDYCQNRPRDVLIYCEFALESALSHRH
jgi:hypothetical protein